MANKVAVLMSTYNGEKFILEQINSILAQIEVTVDIYIRDDGSKDKTTDIIENINDPRIKLIRGSNVGYKESFAKLIWDFDIDADYYAFSDQDDIWLEDKLIAAIKKLEAYSIPTMYASNSTLFNVENDNINDLYGPSQDQLDLPNYQNYKDVFINVNYFGNTIVFNRKAYFVIKEYQQVGVHTQHDRWISLVISLCGQIIFDNESHLKYRQHSNNAIGGIVHHNNLFKKIKTFLSVKMNYSTDAADILTGYGNLINKHDEQFLTNIKNSKVLKSKMALLFDKEFKGKNLYNTIVIKILMIMNRI